MMPKAAPRPSVIAPRPSVTPRPMAVPFNRGASVARQQARDVKREAFNQMANQANLRPRPAVRPAAPPPRIMPKQPAPAIARPPQARPGVQVVRPGQLPKRPGVQPVRPGAIRPVVRPVAPPAGAPKGIQKARPTPAPSGLKSTGKTPTPVSRPSAVGVGAGAAGMAGAAALAAFMLNTGAAHPQISMDVTTLNYSLQDLQNRSSLSQIQAAISELDAALNHALGLLESARSKGYMYQKELDEIAYQAMDQWQSVRDQVTASIPQQAAAFQSQLGPLGGQVARLNSVLGNPAAATPLVSSTATQVNSLLSELNQVESSLQANYQDIQSQCSMLTTRLNAIHWALGQLDEAKFKMGTDENLVNAVSARWDQEGDDDPEG
ncbi:MAG: hypothetical protein JW726_03190, partial [Anaerolineales bacterium]|nr:hypothetical protein [Anaerolineales bacterium]